MPDDRIGRDDLEAKLREIRGEVDNTADMAKPALIAGAVVAAVAVLGVVYFLGMRKGRRKSTLVEIRRV